MNLIFRYLEQKGITPRYNNKPINWNKLIGIRYDMQIDRMSCFEPEFKMYRFGSRTVQLTLEFDLSIEDSTRDFEGILEPSHDRLEFIYNRNHVTLQDVYLIKYDVDYEFDCGSSRLIVELIAKDIIINSNVTGGK